VYLGTSLSRPATASSGSLGAATPRIDESFLKWSGGGIAATSFISGHHRSRQPWCRLWLNSGFAPSSNGSFGKPIRMSVFLDLARKEPPGHRIIYEGPLASRRTPWPRVQVAAADEVRSASLSFPLHLLHDPGAASADVARPPGPPACSLARPSWRHSPER